MKENINKIKFKKQDFKNQIDKTDLREETGLENFLRKKKYIQKKFLVPFYFVQFRGTTLQLLNSSYDSSSSFKSLILFYFITLLPQYFY